MDILSETAAWLADPAHWSGADGIPARLAEHIGISLVSLLIAVVIGLPLGLWVGHTRRGSGVVIGLAGVARAVPSLALIGLVIPITQAIDPDRGFGLYPTVFAMVALAIPPILVNAFAGVQGVDAEVVEAARGQGLTEGQVLRRVELPLALPVVLGGVRSASIQIIGTTTLGAIFGLGALGRFIVDGIAQNDDGMLFGGVVLVAVLAMASEALLAGAQRLAEARSRPGRGRSDDAARTWLSFGGVRPWWEH